MSNSTSHIFISTFGTWAWGTYFQNETNHQYRWGLVVGGIIGGLVPDRLEPPVDPNHRGTFHSVGSGVGLAFGTSLLSKATSNHKFISGFIHGLTVGYILHLVSDAMTPAGIRII